MSTPNESNITKTLPRTTHLPASFPALYPPLSAREVISRRLKTKIGKAEEQIGKEGRQSRQAGRQSRQAQAQKAARAASSASHTLRHTDTLTYVAHRIGWGFSVAPEPGYRLSPLPSAPMMFVVPVLGGRFSCLLGAAFQLQTPLLHLAGSSFPPDIGPCLCYCYPLALRHLPRGVPSTLTTAALISIIPAEGVDIEHAKFML